MQESLKVILEIQELDMKMIRLMRVKKERQKELEHINAIKADFLQQSELKEKEVLEIKKEIRVAESLIAEANAKIERLETKQNSLKKVEEFSAVSHEITAAERERTQQEQQLSDLTDRLIQEEEVLKQIQESLKSTDVSSKALEKEINESIALINKEGQGLQKERDVLKERAPEDLFKVYERLIRNKKDRVVVPIENRTCSGCHIVLTAQHENLVRRGERPVFCEHCSRLHYWLDSEMVEDTTVATKKRRRRASA
ncbi:MAG: C4-type zinc ribbon domain-containing protein [Chlamydiales bacterium]|nr:C4-type zinc ribbon domain-containing protein [Chlamydiales bacterium]